jgi:hypothetical protein
VGTITTLALLMLVWPLIPFAWRLVRKVLGRDRTLAEHTS